MPNIDFYPPPKVCPYCGAAVVLSGNSIIYGKPYGNGKVYICTRFSDGCKSYVSVHDGTEIPMGRMADPELRQLRKECHKLFDALWRQGGSRKQQSNTRRAMYRALARRLDIPRKECHIGFFDNAMARRALEILQEPKWWKNRRPE